MLNYGARGTAIRVLAVAGALAVAMLTSAGTSSAALGYPAGVVDLTDTGVVYQQSVRLQSAGSAPRQASPPMETPGERRKVPGMEMEKPTDAPGERRKVPGMEMDKPAGAPAQGDSGGHGDSDGHSSTVSPTKGPTSGDMPGMDMPADSSGHGDAPAGDAGGHGDAGEGDAGGHGEATEPAATERPLLPVLGAFGGGTAVVMLTAGMMRHKDRERLKVRQAARAARRSEK